MKSVEKYAFIVDDKLRNGLESRYTPSIGIMFTFLALFEKEIVSRNEQIISQVEGEFKFIRASTISEIKDSLKDFLLKNPHLKWMNSLRWDLTSLGYKHSFQSTVEFQLAYLKGELWSDDLFIELKEVFSETSISISSVEFLKAYFDWISMRGYNQMLSMTPPSLRKLVVSLLEGMEINAICDLLGGSGGLIYEMSKSYPQSKFCIQESDHRKLDYCRMLFALSGRISDEIIFYNSYSPEFNSLGLIYDFNENKTTLFDVMICHPPFSRGVPYNSSGEYEFINANYWVLEEDGGKGIFFVSSGALYRGGHEESARRELVNGNKLDAVISFPGNMLYESSMPINILILKRDVYKQRDVLFINGESFVTRQRSLNVLSEDAIREIAAIYHNREDRPKVSRCVNLEEIAANRYNLRTELYLMESPVFDSCELETMQVEYVELRDKLKRENIMLANKLTSVEEQLDKALEHMWS